MVKKALKKFFGVREGERRTYRSDPPSTEEAAKMTHVEIHTRAIAVVAIEPRDTFQERAQALIKKSLESTLAAVDETMIVLNDDLSVTAVYPPVKKRGKETIQ